MVSLVIGRPDSGKSKMAEDMAVSLSHGNRKVYIATMIPYGEEGKERIEKHRKMREGKGFETIECPRNLKRRFCGNGDAASDASGANEYADSTALLECIANLTSNVLFGESLLKDDLAEYIASDVSALTKVFKNLVIVSNNYEIRDDYDLETRKYIELIDKVNDLLKDSCDKVYELSEDGSFVETDK